MLHQALISYSPSPLSSPRLLFASSPSAASTTSLPTFVGSSAASVMRYPHGQCSVVGTEGRMEALRNGFRPQEAAEEAAPAAWGLPERGGLLGEGFSVEDLLDLEELCEADRDGGDQGEAPAVEEEEKSNDSHGSSVVSYELMPPPPPPPPPEIDLPAHDAEELEWVSRFIDDSLTELPPLQPAVASAVAARPPQPPAQHQQAAAHPSRSSTICALSTESLVPVKAKRSRRTRAAVWTLSGSHPFSDSTSSSSTTTTSSCSSSASFSSFLLPDTFAAFDLLDDLHLPPPPKKSKNGKNSKHKPKKRGRKPKHPPPHLSGAAAAAALPASGDRRCSHCGVQKTPQWRAGPEGAKTLCNACGVRYKSGRLLPEYRPACSPTFVSSLHSNSHRKVLEMRRKKEAVLLPAAVPAVASF